MERVTRVVEATSGRDVTLDEALDDLVTADVVFLGETHLDETTHRLEEYVLRGLASRTGGRVVLALEMFERDVQDALDDYLAGEIDEAAFLAKARPWSNYRTAYRPLIEAARELSLPVLASNFPAPLRRKIGRGGQDAFDALTEAERALVPRELHPPTDAYWERVMNAVRGHRNMMGEPSEQARLLSGQNLWDNAMGETCGDALDLYPGFVVLHINGGFHSAYRDGTVHQLLLRRPDADVRTVSITPVPDPHAVRVEPGSEEADYLAYVSEIARDVNEGAYGVRMDGELRYRLHVPEGASDARPAPLLLLLPDDGFEARDVLDRFVRLVGDEAAVAAFEPTHMETQEDLSVGGRWAHDRDFSGDMRRAAAAVERAWGYLLRRHPIDPERVVIAGEGTGATLAVVVAVFADRLSGRVLAFSPRRYRDLADFPLPLDEEANRAAGRPLVVYAPEDAREFFAGEIGQYREVGIDAALGDPPPDPWLREPTRLGSIRSALGLSPPPRHGEARAHIVIPDTPKARAYARRIADARAENGELVAVLTQHEATRYRDRLSGSRAIETGIRPEDFAMGGPRRLPRAPGPFGGTTVVVLDASADDATVAAWRALTDPDVLAAHSRFHRLRVASRGELATTLKTLASENRRNVLLVPAVFAAGGDLMRAIRDEVRAFEDDMTIHFLPGLGGALGTHEEATG